ncbi:MAG TPA: Spy/CpxP family protein refolding chaperone [Burkholderiales bacterium]|nr:Spy/CpxP family protein refolding chaperone [Burkholderiales bacterium]
MNKLIVAALASAGLATAAPLSLAQGAEDSAAPGQHFAHRQQEAPRAFRSPVERIEARLAYLKTALKITPEQEPQWNAYAEVLRKHAREAAGRIEQMRAQPTERQPRARPSAVERLERRQAMATLASARISETLAALKPLYAALSPEQRQIADELLAPRGRGGMHHAGHGRGRV